jgi:hypothetical protein
MKKLILAKITFFALLIGVFISIKYLINYKTPTLKSPETSKRSKKEGSSPTARKESLPNSISLPMDYKFSNETIDYIYKNFDISNNISVRYNLKSNWIAKKKFLFELGRLNKPVINKLLIHYYYKDKKFKDTTAMLKAAYFSLQNDHRKNYKGKEQKVKFQVMMNPENNSEIILLITEQPSNPLLISLRESEFIKYAKRDSESGVVWLPIGNEADIYSYDEDGYGF